MESQPERGAQTGRDDTKEAKGRGSRARKSAGKRSKKPLLSVNNLTFTQPDGRKVFDGLDLEAYPGETVVIMGGSGVGKTTLAELIFDLKDTVIDQGSIDVDLKRAALLLQEGGVFEHLTVGENLAVVLRHRGKRPKRARLRRILDQVGLGSIDLKRKSDALSGGQRRRLALARAICSEPELLYCDEPSAGLDLDSVLELGALLRSVAHRDGRGAVIVTHDPLLAALTGDRVLIMEKGALSEIASWPDSPDTLDEGEVASRARRIEELSRGRLAYGVYEEKGKKASTPAQRIRTVSPLRIGDYAITSLKAVLNLPVAIRYLKDFAAVFARAFNLSGTSGIPFFALVGGILGATFIMILLGASILPARITLEKVRAVPLTAMAPPLAAFLFAARSGSAISSWLGSMGHSRQVDALQSLRISPNAYLRAPCWIAMVLGFALAAAAFFGAMWVGAWLMVTYKVGLADAAPLLDPFENAQITFHAKVKGPLYAVLIAAVTTHVGLEPKRTAEDVARGTTHVIIVCTVLVVLVELLFAGFIAAGGIG
jgi:osmoprotectant transport system ATP-binding protein